MRLLLDQQQYTATTTQSPSLCLVLCYHSKKINWYARTDVKWRGHSYFPRRLEEELCRNLRQAALFSFDADSTTSAKTADELLNMCVPNSRVIKRRGRVAVLLQNKLPLSLIKSLLVDIILIKKKMLSYLLVFHKDGDLSMTKQNKRRSLSRH